MQFFKQLNLRNFWKKKTKNQHTRIRGQVRGSACSAGTRLTLKLLDGSHLRQPQHKVHVQVVRTRDST